MTQLIKQEFKKIFKKKYFLVLLLLFLGVSGYLTYDNYNSKYTGDHIIQDDKGVELTGVDALRYIDSERHRYAGTINEEFVEKFTSDFDTRVKNAIKTDLTIDEEKMIANYGKDYEQLFERAENRNLTSNDWNIISDLEPNLYEMEDGKTGAVHLSYIYKNEGIIAAFSSIYDYANDYLNVNEYIQYWTDDKSEYTPVEYIATYRFAPLLFKEEHLATPYPENPADDYEYKSFLGIYNDSGTKIEIDSKIIDYYNERFMAAEPYYDSTLPNQYLINNLSNSFGIILAILLIIVILSDMFSYDHQTKADQIITCSPYGYKKLKVAKLIVGICTALGVILLQQILIILISNFMLPIRDLSLVETGYDSISSFVSSIDNYIEAYGSILLTGIIMLMLGGLVVGMITMFISYITKNKFITAITMILITFALIFFVESYAFQDIVSIILPYIPYNFMKFTIFHNFVYDTPFNIGIIPYTMLFNNIVAVRDIVIVVWLALCAGMGTFISFVKFGEVKSK